MQRQQLDPINKHRSEIQRRLNQLELKFAQTNQNVRTSNIASSSNPTAPNPTASNPTAPSNDLQISLPNKFLQEHRIHNINQSRSKSKEKDDRSTQAISTYKGTIRSYGNENEGSGFTANISKTVEMRPNYRHNQSKNNNRQLQYNNNNGGNGGNGRQRGVEPLKLRQHQRALQPIQCDSNRPNDKDEKIKELQHMIKSILDGQIILQRELNQLKNKDKPQKQQPPYLNSSEKQQVKGISNQSVLANDHRNKKENSFNNTSEMIKQSATNNIESETTLKQRKVSRRNTPLKQKQKQFQQFFLRLRSKEHSSQRLEISDDLRNRFWAQVEGRIRQSDGEYRDTLHRNSKHEFQHLMNTYELQRKLKDQLVSKVYQGCNNQVYK